MSPEQNPKPPRKIALLWSIGGAVGLIGLFLAGLKGGPLLFAAGWYIVSAAFLWLIELKKKKKPNQPPETTRGK